VFQRPSGSPLGEWLQSHLGPLVVAFFVFILPAVKAALAGKKQRAELKQGKRSEGDDDEAEEVEETQGQQTWKDLLEGRRQSTPPPLPTRMQAPEPAEEESLDDNPPPALVELPSARSSESGAEEDAEAYVTARERQESERQEQVAAAEYVASSPYRADVAPREASAVPIVSRPAAAPQGAAERWLFPTTPARDRRAAMRRAIVLREVLGPPVGLR
jgi:hypothetical protein